MSKLPDFEGLALFAKVAESRSFAAAARELDLSVPTVSRGIARLETRLGARVFNRTSRRLALTAFGQDLLGRASQLYRDAEEAEAIARDQSASPRGTVRLAVPMTFGVHWIAPLLPGLLERYPQLSLDLHLSDAKVDVVGDGFDAALRIAALPDSALAARRLCPVARYTVAAPSYVARYGNPSHPRDLDPAHCLAFALRAGGDTWRFSNGRKQATLNPLGRLRVTNSEALLPVLLAGHAVAALPEFMAAQYLRDGRLVALLPQWKQSDGGLYFVTPTKQNRPAKVEAVANYFVEMFASPPWRQ
ncbi:LysR family transcriptional regulator [Pseudoxanthomonas composti]|uniref:LysR family transcriptional regulator n=1 Tax=Pseudoxanthomonas composti TaxID=2137479 RepID=A0A4V1N144_9GAMM|nr:LysR family transcriptional regulator [Pseudoxanthomonas composti]RXR05974.1 LysR family transcriptional regulator [Pseudoxanthomonas composti]